jgi:hypothetical protein
MKNPLNLGKIKIPPSHSNYFSEFLNYNTPPNLSATSEQRLLRIYCLNEYFQSGKTEIIKIKK